jgi:hypothetical protein
VAQLFLPGTAGPGDVLSGKTFSAGTNYNVAGIMPNNGALTITPGTADQPIPAGYHNGSGKVKGDPNLVAGNIKSGVSIFGVAGSVIPGKRFASGQITPPGNYFTVSGLSFQPGYVMVEWSLAGVYYVLIYNYNGNSTSNYCEYSNSTGTPPSINWTINSNGFTVTGLVNVATAVWWWAWEA